MITELVKLIILIGGLGLITIFLLAFMSWLADRYIRAKLRHEIEEQIKREAEAKRRIIDEYS